MKLRADRRIGLLLGGVVLAVFMALAATVALPATDPDLGAGPARLSEFEVKALEREWPEGCWYCQAAYAATTQAEAPESEDAEAEDAEAEDAEAEDAEAEE